MILTYVTECPVLIIVTPAVTDPKVLGSGYLNMIEILWGHKWFEDPVTKAEGQNILQSFFAEIVVEAEYLVFSKMLGKQRVEGVGGVTVGANRFFD